MSRPADAWPPRGVGRVALRSSKFRGGRSGEAGGRVGPLAALLEAGLAARLHEAVLVGVLGGVLGGVLRNHQRVALLLRGVLVRVVGTWRHRQESIYIYICSVLWPDPASRMSCPVLYIYIHKYALWFRGKWLG